MCVDPGTAFLASSVISGGGKLLSGFSAMKTGQANEEALNQQAQLREEKGAYDAEQAMRRFRRAEGTTIAGAAASGLSLSSFSQVFADDSAEASLEKQTILWGATNDANNIRYRGSVAAAEGKGAFIGSIFSAAGDAFAGYGKADAYSKRLDNKAGGSAGSSYGGAEF